MHSVATAGVKVWITDDLASWRGQALQDSRAQSAVLEEEEAGKFDLSKERAPLVLRRITHRAHLMAVDYHAVSTGTRAQTSTYA